MGAIDVAVVQGVLDIADFSNKDFTDSGVFGGDTPKAAIVFTQHITAYGTNTARASFSVGFIASTTERSVNVQARDGQTTEDCDRRGESLNVVHLMTATGAQDGKADGVLIANGVKLQNSGTAFAGDYLCTIWLIGGDDMSCVVGEVTSSATEGNKVDVTTMGFKPDWIMTISNRAAFNNTRADNLAITIGLTHRTTDTAGENRSLNVATKHGSTNGDQAQHLRSDECCRNFTKIAEFGGVKWVDFDSNGASVETTNSNSAVTVAYLAVNMGDNDFKTWTLETPVTDGVSTDGGPGFQPDFVLYLMTFRKTEDSSATGSDTESWGVSLTDGSTHTSLCCMDDHNVATIDTNCRSNNIPVDMFTGNLTQDINATFSSMASTGPAFDWSDTPATTGYKWHALAFREGQTSGFVPYPKPRGLSGGKLAMSGGLQ